MNMSDFKYNKDEPFMDRRICEIRIKDWCSCMVGAAIIGGVYLEFSDRPWCPHPSTFETSNDASQTERVCYDNPRALETLSET